MVQPAPEEVREISAALKRAEKRKKRKRNILAAIAVIVVIAMTGFLFSTIPLQPTPIENTCLNGIQDQGEEGIDCGGPCPVACEEQPPPPPPTVDPAYVLPASISDIALDLASDRIYVLDEMRHRIMVYDSEFNHIKNFGETRQETSGGGMNYQSGGITNDRLLFPASIYVANNKIYVLDRVPRIQVFSKDLRYEKTLNFSAEALEKLPKLPDTPNADGGASSIAVSSNGKIYVADEVSNAIAVFDSQLNLIKAVTLADPGSVNMPRQIALGLEGNLFVSDSANSRIQVFDSELNFVKSITQNLLLPVAIAVSNDGKLFVFDNGDSRLKVLDSEGKLVEQVGNLGTGELEFYNSRAVKFDSEGKIYIVEGGNARIQVLGKDLGFERKVDAIRRTFNVSFTPFYPAISPNGDIAVSDPINNKVFILGSDFRLKKALGGKGFGDYEFNTPKGLAFDSEGKLFVSDSGNRRIQIFFPDYKYLGTITNDLLIWPLAISVSEQGKVFVVDDKYKKVLVFNEVGDLIGEMSGGQGITLPLGILAKGGKVYITDDLHKTIEIFDSDLKKLESIADIDAQVGAHVEFNESLAINSNRLLFCDNRNRKVVAFNLSDKSFSTFGSFGSSVLELSILEVSATEGLIAVADMEHHRVKLFDSGGKELREITTTDLS